MIFPKSNSNDKIWCPKNPNLHRRSSKSLYKILKSSGRCMRISKIPLYFIYRNTESSFFRALFAKFSSLLQIPCIVFQIRPWCGARHRRVRHHHLRRVGGEGDRRHWRCHIADHSYVSRSTIQVNRSSKRSSRSKSSRDILLSRKVFENSG